MSEPALAPVSGLFGLQASSLETRRLLDADWWFCACEPDAFTHPRELEGRALEWLPAVAPCTVAGALRAAARFDWDPQPGLENRDYWFMTRWDDWPDQDVPVFLHFEGLATLADVFINGRQVLSTDNMFRHYVCEVEASARAATGQSGAEIHIRFRSLAVALESRRPRARWRTRLTSHRNLRWFRTSLLGHMPGVCPAVPAVGPWRPVALVTPGRLRLAHLCVLPSLQGSTGVVEVVLELDGAPNTVREDAKLQIAVGEHRAQLTAAVPERGACRFVGVVRIDDVQRWWPHTHGTPHLYPACIDGVVADEPVRLELAPVGFRSVALHDPQGEAELRVNDVSIFCRGACWSPIDLVTLSASQDVMRRALEDARDAGMNLLRISGNMVYESTHFYTLCDALGILVWQDFMFASMDYPTGDPAFAANIEGEVRDILDRIAYRPSLAVLCGGSELQQQPALLGLPAETWRSAWFDTRLPELCHARRPDVPYCSGSPSGGVMPFHVDQGIGHYFGVGGYRRGLEDAWIAEPRFATECLAFAIPPEGPSGADPGALVPRDAGVEWDFMDVTDHYVQAVYGCNPANLDDVIRVGVRRAAVGEVMARVQAVWRRPDARCRGALVWLLRDFGPGSGVGLVDASGFPKAPLHYLRRIWAPVALFFLDRGVNGLRLIIANDTASDLQGALSLRLSRLDGTVVGETSTTVVCRARTSQEYAVETLLGTFIDSGYAYRFGPPAFDVVRARLVGAQLADPAEALDVIYLRDGVALLPRQEIGLRAVVTPRGAGGSCLHITTERFAQTVMVDAPGLRASDGYFHLSAGDTRALVVEGSAEDLARSGTVSALNAATPVPITLGPDRHEPART